MAKYGLDLYGESYYGRDVVVSYSVGKFTATQTGYGAISLSWNTPANLENWGVLRIVRNTAGYPASETDGEIILEITPEEPSNSYTDAELTGGRFYYYAVFLSSNFPAYVATEVYQAGDTVSYNGSNWLCTVDNTVGVAPATGTAQWVATNSTALWNRAGQACSLAVADYGYRSRLYDLVPAPYATAQQEVSTPQDPPSDLLYRYLSVLAWGLDMARTELGEQESLHRVSTMPLSRMELLANQLGVDTEASITPRLRRLRVANAASVGKRRGTVEAIKESIYDATGYDSSISVSPNLMLDADQAEARSPRYPVWDPSVTYQVGSVVSYQGYLYTAASNTVQLEAEALTRALNGAPASKVQGNTSTAVYSNNQQVLVQSNATGQGCTFTFTVPSAGNYDIALGLSRGKDYGIVTFQIDGVQVVGNPATQTTYPRTSFNLAFDGWAKSSAPATSVYLGRRNLTAGTHTVKITVVAKNGKSAGENNGYQFGVDYLTYTPQGAGSGIGISPTGTTSSNAFWTYTTAKITSALDNPMTGGVSTWEQVSFTAGATASNDSLDVYSGYLALNGTGDHTANLTVMKNGTGGVATLAAHSIAHARVTAWSADTVYPRGAYVSYNGANYLCILPTSGGTPDSDRTHWQPETISTTGTDRFLVSSYGIPIPQHRTWSPAAQYASGDLVEYQGELYRASRPVRGTPPTGAPTDNLDWAWSQSATKVFTASAYTSRYSGTGTPSRSVYIEWYDAAGNLITTINPSVVGSNPDLLVSFERNSANVVSDPSYTVDNGGNGWQQTGTDTPVASSGMFYWGTRNSNNNATGRHLYMAYDRADAICVGVTFLTDTPAGVENGITFRRSSPTDCFSVSRDRLVKIVAGSLTSLATWSYLPNGSRVYVQLSGTNIRVMLYQGPGLAPQQLANVTDSFNATATGIGLFERTR